MSFPLIDEPVVAKVGGILLRENAAQQMEIFILRPTPKNPNEQAKFVLPRGSRQYSNAQGEWVDARDQATAQQFADRLEPLARTLAREMEEEAGLPVHCLAEGSVEITPLGMREFHSATKGRYPVYWFLLRPDASALAAMDVATPADAETWGWKTRDAIQALADGGDFSVGYLAVIDEALRG